MTLGSVLQNHLLEPFGADILEALALNPVPLNARERLQEPGTPVLHAYFPISAVVSLVSTMEGGAAAEVALIGREGMVGLAGILGTVESPTTAVVLIPGEALKAPIAALKAARLRFPSLRAVLDRYIQARLIQVAQTAACNGLHSVEARLARWLLALDDRIEGAPFTLPHEVMAHMVGVARPSLSISMQRLQESKAITYRGRSMTVSDRSRLESMACECHGVIRREFERLRSPANGGAGVIMSEIHAVARPEARGNSAAVLETMRQIAGRLLLASIHEQEAREEAEAANRTKDQFLAMVSHELRTPLNAILGWCALLSGPRKGSVEHGLHVIQQNATAQLKLVEDLLDAVRLTSSTLAIQPATTNLGDVVQHAVDAAMPLADEKRVTLHLAIDEISPLVADADRLQQVFLNVVSNAVKFTDAGGSVDVSVTATGRGVQVTVRDTGRGIGPEELPHVFEQFRQASPSASGSLGLGLGLTIAKALVELHGGRIQLASPGEGLGTTCTIDLPLPAAS